MRARSVCGSASADADDDEPFGEVRLGVGSGETGFPFRRARELWKDRIEERRRWRIVGGRGVCEENVKPVVGLEAGAWEEKVKGVDLENGRRKGLWCGRCWVRRMGLVVVHAPARADCMVVRSIFIDF